VTFGDISCLLTGCNMKTLCIYRRSRPIPNVVNASTSPSYKHHVFTATASLHTELSALLPKII
jgi:hypothetical protein